MNWHEAEPGDAFLCWEADRWAIWKFLDGSQLALARKLGYTEEKYPRVVSMILTGDDLNPPATGKTDDNDPPYAMESPDHPMLQGVNWTYLGKL